VPSPYNEVTMFRAIPATHSLEQTPLAPGLPLQVRIGIEDIDYDVHDLSPRGFAIIWSRPLPPDATAHVSFRLAPGLSISLQATARSWQADSERQWFEFGDVDRDILAVLLLASGTSIVH
jgi:hypothetical protein